MSSETKTWLDIIPYEEIPEATRDYVDFIFNVADLGEEMGKLRQLEEQRIELHKRMVSEYGLRYEYTRSAVCFPRQELVSMRPERVAQVIDSNLRWIRDAEPASRILENEGGAV